MTISWQSKETKNTGKLKPLWLIIFIAAGLGLLVFGFIQKNFIFIILTILLIFVIYQFSRPREKSDHFRINEQGVSINRTFYPYDFLKSFWIFYEPGVRKELSIESKKTIMPYIKMPLTDQDPNQIRNILLQYLPEVQQEDSLIDIIAHRLKF